MSKVRVYRSYSQNHHPPGEHSLIDHLNFAMDDSDSALNFNNYFEPNEMINLIEEHSQSLSFFI